MDEVRGMKKSTRKRKARESGEKKGKKPDLKKAARQVIEAVAHDVRIHNALEGAGIEWRDFEAVLRGDASLKRDYLTARETIEELWRIEKREQLHDAAMGRVPRQVATPKGGVVTIYEPSIPALIRGIDQDSPKPRPVEHDADAEALTAFQAALKLHAEVIGKKGGAGK